MLGELLKDTLSGVCAVGVLTAVAALVVPTRCRAPKQQSPHDPCALRVQGVFGSCRYHGRPALLRVIAVLGGMELLSRRTCRGCRQPVVFGRTEKEGLPYLVCQGRNSCRNGRVLLRDHVRRRG